MAWWQSGRMLRSKYVAVAERVLGQAMGTTVQLREVAELRAFRVARFAVEGIGRRSVIVKVPEEGPQAYRGRATIHNELAALQLLGRLGGGMSPELLAADPEIGVLVMEDLGDGASLASLMLGNDPQAASGAAIRSASALGAMHAASIGHVDEYYQSRQALSTVDPVSDRFMLRSMHIGELIVALPGLLAIHDLPAMSSETLDEFGAVVEELAEPRAFLALSGGDPCPDNERHALGAVRFFDFETASYRHALLDAAHYRIPFPNCWCWRLLPQDLTRSMETAYRRSLASECPAAADDMTFTTALSKMVTAWLVWTLHRRMPTAAHDELMRQRTLIALDGITESNLTAGPLPKISGWAESARADLARRWSTTTARAETYPAFGGPPFSLAR